MTRHIVEYKGYDQTVIEFVSSQKKGTRNTYKCFMKHILEFTGMTGQQLLESKKADTNFEWERKIMAFKQWLKTPRPNRQKPLSDNATRTAVNTVRSFFDYYRTPLRFSQQEKRKVNGKAQRSTQDYMLTNEDLYKMTLVGDLRDKYLVLLGKSFGLRAGDFILLKYGDFRSVNLENEPPISIGELQTQKEGIIAYPFIDSDALPILKAILEANKDKPDNQRVITVDDEELSTIMQRLAKKAGIHLGTKRLRFHCLRKYLIDRLSLNTSESKWKQIVGKAISEEAYISRFELREIYSKAMKLTTIYTNGNGKVSKLSEDVAKLQEELKEDKQTIGELKNQLEKIQELTDYLIKAPQLAKIDEELAEKILKGMESGDPKGIPIDVDEARQLFIQLFLTQAGKKGLVRFGEKDEEGQTG